MNGENVQHIYQQLFTTTLLTLIVPGNSDLKQVSCVVAGDAAGELQPGLRPVRQRHPLRDDSPQQVVK